VTFRDSAFACGAMAFACTVYGHWVPACFNALLCGYAAARSYYHA
jgi:hypothetical protein